VHTLINLHALEYILIEPYHLSLGERIAYLVAAVCPGGVDARDMALLHRVELGLGRHV